MVKQLNPAIVVLGAAAVLSVISISRWTSSYLEIITATTSSFSITSTNGAVQTIDVDLRRPNWTTPTTTSTTTTPTPIPTTTTTTIHPDRKNHTSRSNHSIISETRQSNYSSDNNINEIDENDNEWLSAMVKHQFQLWLLQEKHKNANKHSTTTAHFFGPYQHCALVFYGLPRAFRDLVLPSVIRNVLLPNAKYNCHLMGHYHALTHEPGGRSGSGGQLQPTDVLLLRDAARLVGRMVRDGTERKTYEPTIRFGHFTDKQFFHDCADFLNRSHHVKDDSGQHLLYFPWNVNSFVFPQTSDNIIRMMYGTRAAWQLLQQTQRELGVNYTRIAMLRDDVFFVTPLDILLTKNQTVDEHNRVAVVPNFANWPVNDRLIYGPANAVEIWANQRFNLIEDHVKKVQKEGLGIHSEIFLQRTIFPAIRTAGYTIDAADDLCFLRARADRSVWLNDCSKQDGGKRIPDNYTAQVVTETLQRNCNRSIFWGGEPDVIQLQCDWS